MLLVIAPLDCMKKEFGGTSSKKGSYTVHLKSRNTLSGIVVDNVLEPN